MPAKAVPATSPLAAKLKLNAENWEPQPLPSVDKDHILFSA